MIPMQKKKTGTKKSNIILSVVAVVIIATAVSTTFLSRNNDKTNTEKPREATISSINENGDLVIPIADVTEKASFYAYG